MEYQLTATPIFERWIARLKDRQAIRAIAARLTRVQAGHFGDHKPLGGGVCELRLTVGPGYRLYYTIRGEWVVLLLWGGHEGTQERDIERARNIVATLSDRP